MKPPTISLILIGFTLFLTAVTETESRDLSVWEKIKRFFGFEPADEFESEELDESEEPELGESYRVEPVRSSRVKRFAGRMPFWKTFFMFFWRTVMSVHQPHFYRNWKAVPFVPVKPYRRYPPTTPAPDNDTEAASESGVSVSKVTGKPETAPEELQPAASSR